MTTLQEAARKALEALKTCSYGDYSAKHVVDPSFDGDAVEAAIESLKAALAQQGEQQPVCHGCGIPAGDVHMSTCQSGKWPSRVSNGDTAAPAPQAQDGALIDEGTKTEPAPQPAHQGKRAELIRRLYAIANTEANEVADALNEAADMLQSAQPVAQPLTDDQIKSMWPQYCGYPGGILDFPRAVREVK